MKFNPNGENLGPRETALIVAAEGLNVQLRSRAHLLAVIDALELDKESVDVKMAYVLALLSLGFSRTRAIARLGLTKNQVNAWRQKNEDNKMRFLESQGRGELMLEETVLLAAERDPEWANMVLLNREKNKGDMDEPEEKDTYDATDFLKKGKLERIIKDPLQ